ncbi:hypothetical protein BC629DRAFT_1198258 [Irpex lacteus]|nr:hypothetical protein BC629DRAFT_1198258 [Irpex lacteus]
MVEVRSSEHESAGYTPCNDCLSFFDHNYLPGDGECAGGKYCVVRDAVFNRQETCCVPDAAHSIAVSKALEAPLYIVSREGTTSWSKISSMARVSCHQRLINPCRYRVGTTCRINKRIHSSLPSQLRPPLLHRQCNHCIVRQPELVSVLALSRC